jgi:hypothetical protein
VLPDRRHAASRKEKLVEQMTLGIDVACRAAHQASLADAAGRFAWSGRRFRTSAADLERLWESRRIPLPGSAVSWPARRGRAYWTEQRL